MIDDEVPVAPIGHNIPRTPEMMRADALATLRDALNQKFGPRKGDFLKSAAAAVVRDRGTAGDAADVVSMANDVGKMVDTLRIEHSKPYRDTADALKGVGDQFWEEVDEAMDGLRTKIDDFAAAEKKRIADQQQEQEKAMAALRQPAPAPSPPAAQEQGREYRDYTAPAPAPAAPAERQPKATPIRGLMGATVREVEEKHFEIEDITLLPQWVLETDSVRAAILAVAKSVNKHMPNIPGIRVTTGTRNRIK